MAQFTKWVTARDWKERGVKEVPETKWLSGGGQGGEEGEKAKEEMLN